VSPRLVSLFTLAAVTLVHAGSLALVFRSSPPEPLDIEPPTVTGILLPAPPAEVVQVPAAKQPAVQPPPEPKPEPKQEPKPEPKPKPKPKPEPKPKPKPKPDAKPEPKPLPPVEAPPSEKAITAPPEPEAEPEPREEPKPQQAASAPVEADNEALGAPVVPPRVDAHRLNNPSPAYPRQSRRLREEGTVILELVILPDGSVGEIKVATSSGYSRLDETALAAVKRWRYVPATRGGKPIAYTYLQPVEFKLD